MRVDDRTDGVDPRRWFTLAIVVTAVLIAALDTTVLNVAIPTILREFHTELPALQWVITGYSLTFATFLVIGGRLGDIYGARRMFVIGAALFGVGSLIAALSTGVPSLVLGEAVVEGIGASLMLPATLAILSTTFRGAERATAFAVWGATAGASVAFGPLLGGFLTTNYSWRWAFGINVIITPLAIAGAFAFMRPERVESGGRRQRIDVPGALLIAAGMFMLVFGLSEGATYGWWRPRQAVTISGVHLWSTSASISIVPVVFVLAVALLSLFYVVERRKERAGTDPLFEFGELRLRTFRYGLLTTLVVAMGQLGFLFVLPVFLQDGKHLSAVENGLWLVPSGVFIAVGAQVGGRLTRRVGTTTIVRAGLVLEAIGLAAIAFVITPDLTFVELLPGFLVFGTGIGFASSQLTNVVLCDVAREKSGAASGANTTVRQIGAALGIAVIGTLLTTQTVSAAVSSVSADRTLAPAVRTSVVSTIRRDGVSFRPPAGIARSDALVLRDALDHAVAAGARPALGFATVVVLLGAAVSFLIPRISMPLAAAGAEAVEVLEVFEPVDVDPALVAGERGL